MHKNFLNEDYPDFNEGMYHQLKEIADSLFENLQTEGMYFRCKDISNYNTIKKKQELFHSICPKEFNTYNQHDDRKKTKVNNEHKGIYVIAEKSEYGNYKPIYVGISGKLRRRVFGQIKVANKTNGSFYKLLSDNQSQNIIAANTLANFEDLRVTIYISDWDFHKLHMLEIFCAGYLKAYWNSFKTH